MHGIIAGVILGAFAEEGARKISWRPLARAAIREGLRAKRGLVEFTAGVREEAKKLVQEAKNELEGSEHQPGSSS